MAQFLDPKVVMVDRKMTERELARAIRMAIAAEEEAVHFYELVADATDNKIVKDIMQDVADEEKVHVGEFQKLLNDMLDDEEEFLDEGAKEVEEMDNEKVAKALVKLAKSLVGGYEEPLVALIDERGKIVKIPGVAIEGFGVFDKKGKEYAGGFDAKGESYGSEVGPGDKIILMNGRPSKFEVGKKYRIS